MVDTYAMVNSMLPSVPKGLNYYFQMNCLNDVWLRLHILFSKKLIDEILADCSQNHQSAKINSLPIFWPYSIIIKTVYVVTVRMYCSKM